MAQVPSIPGTAARDNLPSARLDAQEANAGSFGGGFARGLTAMGDAMANRDDAIAGFEAAKARDHKQLSDFNNQAAFLEFSSQEATRLEEAQRAASGGAADFTQTFMGGFDENAEKWLGGRQLDAQGRAEWNVRVQQLRGTMAGGALQSEFQARDQHYRAATANSLNQLQSGIIGNPDGFEDYTAQGEEIINSSGLAAGDKEVAALAWRRDAAQAYGTALAQRDPAGVIQALGGPVTEAGDATGDGATKPEEKTAFDYFRTQGWTGVQAAGIIGHLIQESGLRSGVSNEAGDSSAFGIAQWTGARRLALETFAAAHGTTKDDFSTQLAFVQHELETSEAPAARRLRAATTVEDAAKAFAYFERAGTGPRGTGAFDPSDPTTMHGWATRLANATRIAGTTAEQTAAPTGEVDPRLANLSFEDRVSLYGTAQRTREAQLLDADRAAQDRQNQWFNQFQLDLQDGKAGTQDIEIARANGQLTDANDVAQAHNIVAARDRAVVDLTTFNTAMATPGFSWNPFDPKQQDALDAGVKAQGGTIAAALDIFTKTGILPRTGGVMLRGALVSQDAAQVGAAATVASNMLARNPNAFAGITGGEDITRAAVTFDHYVNGLGYSAEEASRRVAQMNDPAYQARVKANDPQLQAFRTEVLRADNTSKILRAVGGNGVGPFGRATLGMGGDQRQAILQDYADLAADHYSRFGDEGAAEAFASQQMTRLYGVSNGVVTKYPPDRVYPLVDGGINYVYQQAADDIKTVTGRTIDPKDVYLMPLPTITAEAWRAGQRAPYAVHYVDTVDGQRVYRVLNGQGFTADPTEALNAQTSERQTDFERQRAMKEGMLSNPAWTQVLAY